jgi:hypothetical protein
MDWIISRGKLIKIIKVPYVTARFHCLEINGNVYMAIDSYTTIPN